MWSQAFGEHALNAVLPDMAHWEFRGSETLKSKDVDLWVLEQKCASPVPPPPQSDSLCWVSLQFPRCTAGCVSSHSPVASVGTRPKWFSTSSGWSPWKMRSTTAQCSSRCTGTPWMDPTLTTGVTSSNHSPPEHRQSLSLRCRLCAQLWQRSLCLAAPHTQCGCSAFCRLPSSHLVRSRLSGLC